MTERKPIYTLDEVQRRPKVYAPKARPRAVVTLDEDPDRPGQRSYSVSVEWEGVVADSTRMGGWSIPEKKAALVARLCAAINAGRVFGVARIGLNVFGGTYVSADSKVLGRTLNADLRRLGF